MLDDLPSSVFINPWYYAIKRGEIYSGMISHQISSDRIFMTASQAITKAFSKYNSNLLIVKSYCMALFKTGNGMYGVFDSHGHGSDGMIQSEGTCISAYFNTLSQLIEFLLKLFHSWNMEIYSEFELQGFEIQIRKSANISKKFVKDTSNDSVSKLSDFQSSHPASHTSRINHNQSNYHI